MLQNKLKSTILALLAIVASVVTMSSCQDDETVNSATATVGMGKSTFSVKENKKIFNVPVVVTGEQNGDINVTVEVSSIDPACVENKHYIVTSKSLRIPKSKKSVNVEIKAIDDRIINPDRSFQLKIVKAEGATINEQLSSTTVILMDNDDIPYERMAGTWVVTAHAEDPSLEEEPIITTWETVITALDEEEDGYGVDLTMSPWVMNEYTMFSHPMRFSYDKTSETATLTLPLGSTMGTELDFGKDDLGNDFTSSKVISATIGLNIVSTGQIVGQVSPDFTKIVFDRPFVGMIYNEQGQTPMQVVDGSQFFAPMFLYYRMEMSLKE